MNKCNSESNYEIMINVTFITYIYSYMFLYTQATVAIWLCVNMFQYNNIINYIALANCR